MRKLLIALLVIGVIAAAALAVFLARFDADRYRPRITQKLEEQLGRPVRIGKISLGWRRGIAFELNGLEIFSGPEATGEPSARIERASAVLRILPLLRRNVQVSSISIIGPHLHVIRTHEGSIQVEGVTPLPAKPAATPAGPVAPAPPSASKPAPPPFLVRLLEVKQGSLRYIDQMISPPLDLEIRDIELSVSNLSLTRPMAFECRMTLLSGQQNIRLKGRATPPVGGRPAVLEDFLLETDLSRLHLDELFKVFPAAKGFGLREAAGQVRVGVERLALDPAALQELQADIRVAGGGFTMDHMAKPLRDLDVEAIASGGGVALNSFSGKIGDGSFSGKGTVKGLGAQPSGVIQGKIENMSLEEILPPAAAGEAALRGKLSCTIGGSFEGITWPEISRTLSGNLQMGLANGVLANMNLLREVFGRITLIPGLTSSLMSRLPPEYQEKFSARDTRFAPIDLTASCNAGVVAFQELWVATDTFGLAGSGQFDLNGNLRFPARVVIEPRLSEAIARSVEELRFLEDDKSQINIPVLLQGSLPRISVTPDLNEVGSRLLTGKGQDLLGGLLNEMLKED